MNKEEKFFEKYFNFRKESKEGNYTLALKKLRRAQAFFERSLKEYPKPEKEIREVRTMFYIIEQNFLLRIKQKKN